MVPLRMIVVIHDLQRQGLSISEIARRTGLNRRMVRKHLRRGWWHRRMARGRCARGGEGIDILLRSTTSRHVICSIRLR